MRKAKATAISIMTGVILAAVHTYADVVTLINSDFEQGTPTSLGSTFTGTGSNNPTTIQGTGVWHLRRGTVTDGGRLLQNTPNFPNAGQDNQFLAFADSANTVSAFQYVGGGANQYTGALSLSVKVAASDIAHYNIQIVAFDDPTKVTFDALIPNTGDWTTAIAGTDNNLTVFSKYATNGSNTTKIDSNQFTTYSMNRTLLSTNSYIGVVLQAKFSGNNASDYLAFDDVSLSATVIPEPSALGLIALSSCFILVIRRVIRM